LSALGILALVNSIASQKFWTKSGVTLTSSPNSKRPTITSAFWSSISVNPSLAPKQVFPISSVPLKASFSLTLNLMGFLRKGWRLNGNTRPQVNASELSLGRLQQLAHHL
jgi:hypothetical protein